MERAWIMIVRRSFDNEAFETAAQRFRLLRSDRIWGSSIKDVAVVLGHTDIILVVEAEKVWDIHRCVVFLHQGVSDKKNRRDRVRSTQTLLAAGQDERPYPDTPMGPPALLTRRAFVGINCRPGTQNKVVKAVRKIKRVVLADIVFGEYDILALVDLGEEGLLHREALDPIAILPGVEKTTTMREDQDVVG